MTYQTVKTLPTISKDQFQQDIVPAGRPVLMKGAASNWPAVEKASDQSALMSYLREGASPKQFEVMRADSSEQGRFFYSDDVKRFNFMKANLTVPVFLDALMSETEGHALYMGSTPVQESVPALRSDFTMPLLPDDVEPRIWMGNQTVVSIHHDGSSNIACVVAGTRTFTLFPPEQVANLYPGPIEHTMAGPQVSMVNLDDPDFDQYPKFEQALETAQVAEMEPGDALYIPPMWWHHVRAHADFNVLVNYWWKDRPQISREPLEALVLSLLAVRQLPEPERDAWKAMFDYFVFQTSGAPMEHLPDDVRGVLGPISPARANQIWQHFTGMMQGRSG